MVSVDYPGVRSIRAELQLQDALQDKCRDRFGALPDLGFKYEVKQISADPYAYRVYLVGYTSSCKLLKNGRYRVSVEKSGRGIAEDEMAEVRNVFPYLEAYQYSEKLVEVDRWNQKYVRMYVTPPHVANAVKAWRTKFKYVRNTHPPYDFLPGMSLTDFMRWHLTRFSNPEEE